MTTNLSTLDLGENLIDENRMYCYRLRRIQTALQAHNVDALITFDPVNTRYATGMRNMQVWSFHSLIRMGLVPQEGNAVVFEYAGSEHLANDLLTVDEVVPAVPLHFGPGLVDTQIDEKIKTWIASVKHQLNKRCPGAKRIAIDNQVPYVAGQVLEAAGFEVTNGYSILAEAQAVKNEDEIRAMFRSIEVAELGIARLQQSIEPGVSENQLWSVLNQTNIEMGGEYMDTRLLSSGPRTNPWYQESSERKIEAGDMIALDTDMIGPYGYDADISRSFLCGSRLPTPRQRTIYQIAYDHVQHNLELLRPGISFRQLSEQAFVVPERYREQTIPMNWHGVSLYGGWPTILGRGFFDQNSEDGEVVPGMTLCVESYVGEKGGPDGVKLEEQVLITESGYRLLSRYLFEDNFLSMIC